MRESHAYNNVMNTSIDTKRFENINDNRKQPPQNKLNRVESKSRLFKKKCDFHFNEQDQLEKIRQEYRDQVAAKKIHKFKIYFFVFPAVFVLISITYVTLTFLFEIDDYSDLSTVKFKALRGGDGIVFNVKHKLMTNSLVSSIQDQKMKTSPNSTTMSDLTTINKVVTDNSTTVSSSVVTNTTKKHTTSFYSKEELSGKMSSTNDKNEMSRGPSATLELSPPVLSNKNLTIPDLNNLRNSWEPINPSDHALFLHMPKTGGTTTKNILGVCHHKVLASEAGIKGHAHDKEIAVVKGYGDSLFVNVDPTTPDGIKHAFDMGFADAHLADLTVTPKLYAIDNLFKPESKGRVISMFRHPIERATSMLNYLKYAEWEPTYIDEFKTMTLEEYTKSPYVENNFYTRVLSDTMEGSLTDDHYKIALYNLQRKVFVGLLAKLDESIDRFEKMFNWNYNYNPAEQEQCREGYLDKGANVGKTKFIAVPEEGTEGYELLAWQNQYDLKLYNVVLQIFDEQKSLIAGKAEDYRLVDTTCSLCELKKEKRTQGDDNAKITFNLDADEKTNI